MTLPHHRYGPPPEGELDELIDQLDADTMRAMQMLAVATLVFFALVVAVGVALIWHFA